MAIDVFVIAGVRLYRQGLTDALAADARFRVVGSAADPDAGLSAMARLSAAPAVVLLDVGLGPGLSSARRLREALPDVKLMALVTDEADESVVAWAEAGAAGFVSPETSLEELMTTLECVAGGGAHCSPRATAALMRRLAALAQARRPEPHRGRLTQRESEVVALIARGLSNTQIARELQTELATANNHVHSVLEKLQVERRGAAAAAMRREA
jgi:DNA-binding NarL/FixJ family response regulator